MFKSISEIEKMFFYIFIFFIFFIFLINAKLFISWRERLLHLHLPPRLLSETRQDGLLDTYSQ